MQSARFLGLTVAAMVACVTGCDDSAKGGTAPDAALDATTGDGDGGPGDGGAGDARPDARPMVDAGCTAGRIGCACADGDCTTGACLDGQCVDCRPGDVDCVCRLNGTCAEGTCAEDRCVACVDGAAGCPCRAGEACDEGLTCMAGACRPEGCVDGAEGCPCAAGDTCDGALRCGEDAVCRACTPDIVGCPCAAGACEGALFCDDETDRCADCPDAEAPLGCPCDDAAEDGCAPELACDGDDLRCREALDCAEACAPGQVCDDSGDGDPVCVFGECVDGFVWDGAACVEDGGVSCDGRPGTRGIAAECAAAQQVCVDIFDGAVCVDTCRTLGAECAAANRTCAPHQGASDATCGDCLPGYAAQDGACVPLADANCVPDAPDSIAVACAALNRQCGPLEGGGAACGDCVGGFTLEPALGRCVQFDACAERVCGPAEYCRFPQEGTASTCEDRPCPDGAAWDAAAGACVDCAVDCGDGRLYAEVVDGVCVCADDVYCAEHADGASPRCRRNPCGPNEAQTPGGECVACNLACGDEPGEAARPWPFTTRDGSCLCETLGGWYAPQGGAAAPLQCDADGDGWISGTAKATFDIDDPATRANFRCGVRRVDRIILENEYHQRRAISLCAGELVDYAPADGPPCQDLATVVVLAEPDALDDPAAASRDPARRPQVGGRFLASAELNPLTRACVSLTGDFNLDGRDDLTEQQPVRRGRIPGIAGGDAGFLFASFSYFVELHRAWYEERVPGLPGQYVVAERSRCEADFPLSYVTGGDWWRSCSRVRRGDFDLDAGSLVGHDFAAWTCPEAAGRCALLPAPAVDGFSMDEDGDRVPDHGLCELDVLGLPFAGPWRGMSHASQFQCVVAVAGADGPHEVLPGQIYTDGADNAEVPFELRTCAARSCPDGGDCREGERRGEAQPVWPNLDCSRVDGSAAANVVGLASARYIDGERGCIDEATHAGDGYSALCPGYVRGDPTVLTSGFTGNYGRLLCSCDRFFGGADCEITCAERTRPEGTLAAPSSFLHVGGEDRGYDGETLEAYQCDPDDLYCQLHPPDAASGFPGGRRGYWLCGETTATEVPPGDVALRGELDGQPVELDGAVRLVPVQRVPLLEEGCDPDAADCWEVF